MEAANRAQHVTVVPIKAWAARLSFRICTQIAQMKAGKSGFIDKHSDEICVQKLNH